MSKPKLIILPEAVEALETLAKAVRETGDDSNGRAGVLCEALRGPVVHGIQLAIEQLNALEQYEATVVHGIRLIQRGQIPKLMWETAEQQAARTLIDQLVKQANKAGLIEIGMTAIDVDPENPSTRITAQCVFLTPAEPKLHLPEGGAGNE